MKEAAGRPPMGVMAVPVGMRPMGQWGQRGQWGFLELVNDLFFLEPARNQAYSFTSCPN